MTTLKTSTHLKSICFNHWCKVNFLDVNVKKTKEIIFDFQEKKPILEPIKINNTAVDIVKTYKYLDSIIDNKLNGNENIEKVYKKPISVLFSQKAEEMLYRYIQSCQCFVNLL